MSHLHYYPRRDMGLCWKPKIKCDKEEAIHCADFFWRVVDESNTQDQSKHENSQYILEKIIVTLMAYFRSSDHEEEWEMVSDQH